MKNSIYYPCKSMFTGAGSCKLVACAFVMLLVVSSPLNAQSTSTTVGTTVTSAISSIISTLILEDCNIPGFTPEQCAEVVQTQEQVNQYASVTRIDGSLFISGRGDLDFTPFDSLEEITGQLVIVYGGQSSIVGFNRLENVGFGIKIANNSQLLTIGGFDALIGFSAPSGALEIKDNPQLTQASGFRNLQTTNRLEILRNPQLQSLSRFNQLRSVAWNLSIEENPSLTAVRGFDSLQNVGDASGTAPFGRISILNNAGLTVINGFGLLGSVETSLSIRGNPQLGTFAGFGSLQSVQSLTFSEMNVTTLPSFSQLQTVVYGISLHNFPSLTALPSFQSLVNVKRLSLRFLDLLTVISGFNSVTSLNFSLNIGSNPNLGTIAGFSALGSVGQPGYEAIPTFEIRNNDKLNIVSGFSILDAADIIGLVYVEGNPLLDCPLFLDELEPMDFSEGNSANCATTP